MTRIKESRCSGGGKSMRGSQERTLSNRKMEREMERGRPGEGESYQSLTKIKLEEDSDGLERDMVTEQRGADKEKR